MEYNKEYENHLLRFEKYIKLPSELKALKEKMKREAMQDEKKKEELRNEELLNPWIITDLDDGLKGNAYIL